MATVAFAGRVVRFDQVRGYGFIASESVGEDVFVHANDLLDDKYALTPGTRVEFEVEEGERGLKASGVRVVESMIPSARVATRVATRPAVERGGDDDGLCDVLTVSEFSHEITEALLDAAPTLTAAQIVQVRQRLVKHAQKHQWVEA